MGLNSQQLQEVEEVATRAATRAASRVAKDAIEQAIERTSLGPSEVEDLVTRAVRQTLLQLGVDSSNPLEMQQDFQHLRAWRTAQKEIKSKGLLAIIGVLASGVLALLLLGFREWIGGK